jgi:hypothetical protein
MKGQKKIWLTKIDLKKKVMLFFTDRSTNLTETVKKHLKHFNHYLFFMLSIKQSEGFTLMEIKNSVS